MERKVIGLNLLTDQLEKKPLISLKNEETKEADRDLTSGKNKTDGSKKKQSKHARKCRDLLYSMSEARSQMKLVKTRGESGPHEANNNRSHGSTGEESKEAQEELSSDGEEYEDKDLNLAPDVDDKSCVEDLDESSQIGKAPADTNDAGYSLVNKNEAGETYIHYGPYVYVIGSETKDEDNYDDIDGCPICYDLDHWNFEFPWLDGVPAGKTVGGMYDIQCKGCDKIGVACCSGGVRPILRSCFLCFNHGHWPDKCPEYKYMPLVDYPQFP